MTRYLVLIRFTEQGVRTLKLSTARAAAFRKSAAKAGVEVEVQLWTTGAYDGALILSGANETRVLSQVARLATLGNVRTETLQAFDAKQFAAIIQG